MTSDDGSQVDKLRRKQSAHLHAESCNTLWMETQGGHSGCIVFVAVFILPRTYLWSLLVVALA